MNYKIICAEHIVCVFTENIISRFDVSVNDVSKEFAKKLRFITYIFIISILFLRKPLTNLRRRSIIKHVSLYVVVKHKTKYIDNIIEGGHRHD